MPDMIRCRVQVGIYRDGLPNLVYGEEVDVDPADPNWADALDAGYLLPLDVAAEPADVWRPGGDTERPDDGFTEPFTEITGVGGGAQLSGDKAKAEDNPEGDGK